MSELRRRSARLQAVEVARSRHEEQKKDEPTVPIPKTTKGRRRSDLVKIPKEPIRPVTPDEGVVSEEKDNSYSNSPNKKLIAPKAVKPSAVKAPARKTRTKSSANASSRLSEDTEDTKEEMPKKQETKSKAKAPASKAPASKASASKAKSSGTARSRAKRALEKIEDTEETNEPEPPKKTKAELKIENDPKKEELEEEEKPSQLIERENATEVTVDKQEIDVKQDEEEHEEKYGDEDENGDDESSDNEDTEGMDSSIPFGNESEDDFVPQKKVASSKTRANPSTSRSTRRPRASAVKARKGFTVKLNDSQDSLSSSSSSDDSEVSEFNTDVEEEIQKAQEGTDEDISFGNDADEEIAEEVNDLADDDDEDDFVPKNPRRRGGPTQKRASSNRASSSKSKSSGPSSENSYIVYKFSLFNAESSNRTKTVSRNSNRSSKASKAPSGRTHLQKKTAQPWQKNISYDDPRSGRKMSKGERKMLEFRQHSCMLASGRLYEMTMEEAAEIVQSFREQARKIKETLILEGNSEKPEAEANSSSEDEWEEMEAFDNTDITTRVEVTVEKQKAEPDWWAFYLRQEVNKCIRENWENTHKAHLLCYIAHLQHIHKTVTVETLIPSLLLTQTTGELRSCIGEPSTLKTIKKIINWYTSTYKPTLDDIGVDQTVLDDVNYRETAHYAALVTAQKYETDLERTALLFALFCSFDYICRVCVNVRPIARSWNLETIEKYIELKENFNKKSLHANRDIQDYWVEVWESKLNRWICVNPTTSVIDEPNGIEALIREPISYVFAIDNHRGVRDVTARYASDYVKPYFRRRRCDKPWLIQTLRKKTLIANRERSQLEDVHFKTELVMRPLPTSLAEFKNHPLYVLEKDLLKFQALYPPIEKQKPIGAVKGHNVYPRDTVYTLQNEKRWEKMARSIRKGEKPYKTVKALTDPRIPVEEREQLYVGIYGYWQTTPFKPPAVKNGKIPRNEFGNVYIYQPSMVPIGTVHLRLNGLPNIARKLNKECAPAVVGWDFHSCSNYPIVEGACVLEKDADLFVKEWNRQEEIRIEKEAKKQRDHAYENWKKLIKGMLRLHYVKTRFGAVDQVAPKKGKKSQKTEESTACDDAPPVSTIIDRTKQASTVEFTLDRLTKF
ncbi:unnamed protein product [Auanema sp. JU1783]|nr:unnamed protein product [Auanema sp. JU1783]